MVIHSQLQRRWWCLTAPGVQTGTSWYWKLQAKSGRVGSCLMETCSWCNYALKGCAGTYLLVAMS